MNNTGKRGRNSLKSACVAAVVAVTAVGSAASAEEFDLNALIAAAQAESGLTVYASTGKIKKAAAAFAEKYGIDAAGTKVKGAAQIELVVREAQSGNVVGDVVISSDAAATLAQLIPANMVRSWVPGDLAATIDKGSQDPLVVWRDPSVWTYNSENNDSCPVSNIWELTESKWNRKVTLPDPLNKPAYADWFNQMETHWDDQIAQAYQSHFGSDIDRSSQSATASWVEALAANAPLLTDSDGAAAEAVGTPGQDEPFFGIFSTSKYRATVDGGLKMAICENIEPFIGFANPSYGLIANGTTSPNTAKLFLHFMMTEDGVSPMVIDGKVSGNSAIGPHPDEPSGVAAFASRLTPHVAETGSEDFDKRQDWQDFWRIHYSR